jgi:hypothetical protein
VRHFTRSYSEIALPYSQRPQRKTKKIKTMRFYPPLLLASAFLTPNVNAQTCDATGDNLNLAKETYSQVCPEIPRADCDPIGGGQWTCSSEKMGNNSPGGVLENIFSEPVIVPVADPAPEIELPETTSSECVAIGSNLPLAITAYEASCMAPRVDCDPVDGGWSCSSGVIGRSAPSQITLAMPTVAAPVVETPVRVVVPAIDPVDPVTAQYTGPAPQANWHDSYSVNGVCYIDGGTDHNALSMLWTINGVTRSVGAWIPFLKTGPGLGNNHTYNDVQCGHGPANDAGDEDAYPQGCPGLIIIGSREGCNVKGPTWQLK